MAGKKITHLLQQYQKADRNSPLRRKYLRTFEPMMIYRTTKTENKETSRMMVNRVLRIRTGR